MDVNLILFKNNGSQKVIPLPSNVTIIGRRQDCDLRIPLMPVSRRHCQLILNNETLKIRDLGSRNGTFLNGKRITDEITAQAGDNITIGPLTFGIQINGQPKEFVSHPSAMPGTGAQPTKKPAPPEKPKTKPAEKEPSGSSAVELTDDLPDELPEIDEDDDFLAELEDI
jgi:pSer/pThr/pTyr-binding forkhead associated (FHA) protein